MEPALSTPPVFPAARMPPRRAVTDPPRRTGDSVQQGASWIDGAAPAPGEGRAPALSPEEASAWARSAYGIDGAATGLPSERDQNFLLQADGERYVLKISQRGEDVRLLEAQNAVAARLAAAAAYRFPRALASRGGREIETLEHRGLRYAARLVEYVPGVPLATVRPHAPALLRGVGRMLGVVDRALAGAEEPALDRELYWDLRGGAGLVRGHLGAIPPERRAMVERRVALFDAVVAPIAADLRLGPVHGDGNDWNVIVAEPADPLAEPEVAGLIDFGDMVRSWIAGEPAIAAAYAMLDRRDPLAAARALVGGYHREHPLSETEIEALFPLIGLRLCTSVTLAAHQRSLRPDNAYLSISERAAWALLERLESVHPRFAHYALRDACGLPPVPASAPVAAWLASHRSGIGPVLDPDPADARRVVLDLSVGSAELEGLRGRDDAAAWTEVLFGRMRAEGATLGLGRYDEARRWYTADAFRVETDAGPEWRTVHLGVDLFAEPGTPVLAPLDGVVHGVRDNAGRLDYGPTVVLRHEPGAGIAFHTLYGHLGPDALALAPGQRVRRGERIGSIGDRPGNGDWAPHLHLQILTDPLDREGEFPGVARPSERSVWTALSPDPNLLLGLPELERAPERMGAAEIRALRRERLGPSLSLSYRRPLHVVRGWMQHLYDAEGQAYLDCVNNVAHVGHCHPRVVEALARQSRVLNTNTRYLHESLVRYAERLAATLPEPLRVCFFVCSGSEANELALRLARAHTGRRDVVVLDAAYHGNTSSLVELSPYKFDGPGGAGRPARTHVVPLPDPYRGLHRGAGTGARYAQHVREAVAAAAARGGAAAFFAEPLPGCGGQIVPPEGFLPEAFRHVREAGGVCVADEVQTGFGRVGSHFWGFETQGAVPDIVTLGKPIGNGHPLGAVVTTAEIAASFANGMEYFNTFGGNPVSCAVGLAVLEVIEAEGLQERALRVGERLLAGLRGLGERHPLIGEVRGRGLFLGIELVRDRETREPAGRHAAYVVERMRDHRILLSTDGPDHNVVKIKPPLQFSAADADRLVATLDGVLAGNAARP
jgi:4-aminobutyrate aminotransferase-like enzyme/Ser/Thr protein kinase RdoA (MazF antagonist)